jgi:TRAP-type C4-dicarboxylate transport system substrate-binding protein
MNFNTTWGAVLAFMVVLCAGEANAQQTTLLVATLSQAGGAVPDKFYKPWAQAVEQSSNGTLKMDVRDGYSIATLSNSLDRLNDDVVQVTHMVHPLWAGRFPLTEVAGLPFMTEKAEDAGVALWRLYKTGLLDKELKDFHPIAFGTFGYSGLHLTKAPKTLDDLRGLKIVSASRVQSEMMTLLGAAPASANPMDAFPALQRGTYDGIQTSWSGVTTFHLNDVTTYHVDAALGTTTDMVTMTQKRYEALPAAARKAIDDNSGEKWTRVLNTQGVDNEVAIGQADARSKGQTIVELNPQQVALWKDKTQAVIDDWLKDRPGGAGVLAKFKELLADVQAGR